MEPTTNEKISRSIKWSIAAVTSPITFTAIGVGIVLSAIPMIAMRVLLKNHKNDVVSLSPSSSYELPVLNDTKKLTVYSHNVAQSRFDIMNAVNRLAPTRERIRELTDEIIKRNDDVVCLQEALHEELVLSEVAKRLQSKGYYVLFQSKPKWGALSSGLLIASKYLIKSFDFKPYTTGDSTNLNYMANKGVMIANLDLGEGRAISVATTHALCGIPAAGKTPALKTADRKKKYTEYFGEARSFISKFAKEMRSNHLIICGDLNASFLNERDGLFYEVDIDAPINALLKKEDGVQLKKLTKAKPLKNQVEVRTDGSQHSIYISNETNHSGGWNASVVEKDAIPLHAEVVREGIELAESAIIGEKQNVLDHFLMHDAGEKVFDSNIFDLIAHPVPRTKKGEAVSDHVSIELTLHLDQSA